MTVVLLPNAGFLSETTRMLAVYRELEELGTPAILATHGGTYEAVLEEERVPWERIPPTQTQADCRKYLHAVLDPVKGSLYSREQLREVVKGEIAFLRDAGAKVVVSGFTLSARLSAKAVEAPLVVTHLGSWIPPVLDRGEFRIREAFDDVFPLSLLPGGLQRSFVRWIFPRLELHTKVFNDVAGELHIEPVRSLFDVMLGDLVLVTDVPDILGIPEEEMVAWRPAGRHYRPDLRFAYAGAIFARVFGEVPERVRHFLETDAPKVYVALASTQPEYLRLVLRTLEDMDVRAVAVTTVHGEGLDCSEKILLCDFLPSHQVMPLCDVAIIHGGQGTVQTAIASGTPLVGIPLQPEQNVNLGIVEGWGGGRTLSLRDLRRGRLRPAVEEILASPRFREVMEDLKRRQARRNGPAEVARRLTALNDG